MLTTEKAAAWLDDYARVIHENAAWLTDLDRQIGDADHGSNLERGMTAVEAIPREEYPDAASLLKKAGMTLVSTVGGAAGPLWGTFFLRFAGALDEPGDDATVVAAAMRAGLVGIVQRGKATEGDKTVVDALGPAVRVAEQKASQGASLADTLTAAAEAAAVGRDATIPMVARKGRASYLGDRSAGVQDPGATSITMLVESAARTLA